MRNKLLTIAKKKITYVFKGEYTGCLTPSEFMALVRAGIVARPYDLERMEAAHKAGKSEPRWIYFRLGSLKLD